MTTTFLTGERVILRGLTMQDLDGPYVSWLNDAEVCAHNSHHIYPYSREQGADYIKGTQGSRSALVLAVVLKETDEHIGNMTLQNINSISQNAEFAVLMGVKEHWGKGLAKEAAFLISHHGFTELNLHRIYCGTNETNIGMQKLAEYLGMKLEGRSREAQYKAGRYNDVLHYGVLREEFYLKFASAQIEQAASLGK